jgi:hypothetical protein
MLTIYRHLQCHQSLVKEIASHASEICVVRPNDKAALLAALRVPLYLYAMAQKRGRVEKLEVAAHSHYSLARTHPAKLFRLDNFQRRLRRAMKRIARTKPLGVTSEFIYVLFQLCGPLFVRERRREN